MAFVYAYIQCLDGPVNWFSLTFNILIQVFLLLTVTLRGYLVSIAYCLFFIVYTGEAKINDTYLLLPEELY